MLHYLRFLIAILTFASSSAVTMAAGLGAYELAPVKIKASLDGRVLASYLETCGAEFAGFLYRPAAGKELKVAAVLRRGRARCTGLRGMQEVPLPLVTAQGFAGISSIDPKLEPFRMRSVSIQNLHLLGKSKKITTSAVYTSQCGEALGLLVFADSKGPQLNILESAAQKASSCNRSSKIYSIAGLSIDRLSQFQLGRKTDELLNPVYQLRRIPVEILKATPAAEGSTFYQISYLRGCNQAPIGLIQAQKQDHLQVSMLVAHYEGMSCPSPTAMPVRTVFEPGLKVWRKLRVTTVGAQLTERLSLARPTSFRWNHINRSKSYAKLEVFTLSSCSRDLGLVSAGQGNDMALGVLQIQSSEPCNSTLKKVSYAYEVELHPTLSRNINALQLAGF